MDYEEGPCPVGRDGHATVCLGYGGHHPQLLVAGGVDDDKDVLGDVWIFDVESRRWREVRHLIYNIYTDKHGLDLGFHGSCCSFTWSKCV